MWFKDIKKRNPVFSHGFHEDIESVLCEEIHAQRTISELVVVKTCGGLYEVVRVTGSEVQIAVTTDFLCMSRSCPGRITSN